MIQSFQNSILFFFFNDSNFHLDKNFDFDSGHQSNVLKNMVILILNDFNFESGCESNTRLLKCRGMLAFQCSTRGLNLMMRYDIRL